MTLILLAQERRRVLFSHTFTTALEGAGGREVWVTSDHVYIYRGPCYEEQATTLRDYLWPDPGWRICG